MTSLVKILKNYLRYLRGLNKIIIWKVKYRGILNISFKQNLRKKVNLKVSGNSLVYIGEELSNRDNLNIVVQNGKLKIGKECFFNINCSITCLDEITIGDRCLFANNVVIVDHDHDFRQGIEKNNFKSSKVVIGKNVWIGANSVILRGTNIGDNCIIGAGSVIKGEYKKNTVIVQERESKCLKFIK